MTWCCFCSSKVKTKLDFILRRRRKLLTSLVSLQVFCWDFWLWWWFSENLAESINCGEGNKWFQHITNLKHAEKWSCCDFFCNQKYNQILKGDPDLLMWYILKQVTGRDQFRVSSLVLDRSCLGLFSSGHFFLFKSAVSVNKPKTKCLLPIKTHQKSNKM